MTYHLFEPTCLDHVDIVIHQKNKFGVTLTYSTVVEPAVIKLFVQT